MGCVSSNLLNQDEDFSTQLGSSALGHHIVSLTSTTYGLLTLDPPSTPPSRFTLGSLFPSEPEVINSWELMSGLDTESNNNQPKRKKQSTEGRKRSKKKRERVNLKKITQGQNRHYIFRKKLFPETFRMTSFRKEFLSTSGNHKLIFRKKVLPECFQKKGLPECFRKKRLPDLDLLKGSFATSLFVGYPSNNAWCT